MAVRESHFYVNKMENGVGGIIVDANPQGTPGEVQQN